MSDIKIGQEINRWTVRRLFRKNKRRCCEVVCECGNVREVGEYQLLNDLSKSCGCLVADRARETHSEHGESKQGVRSPEYRAYQLAKARCENSAHPEYAKFGGAGIKFKFSDFDDFLSAVGRRPDSTFVLSRIEYAGDYEPKNIFWTQNKNRRR